VSTAPFDLGGANCCADCRQVLCWCRENNDSFAAFNNVDEMTFSKSLFDPVDSIDIAEMVTALEDGFSVRIPDAQAYKCRTLGDIVGCVVRLRKT